MVAPGVLLILVRIGPPVREEDGATAVGNDELLARSRVGIDASEGVGEVDDICRRLRTFRERRAGRRRRGYIESWIEVPDDEHLVVCGGECEVRSVRGGEVSAI